MNAEHEDEEFVGLRVSGHTRQNSDTPPEFTGHGWNSWSSCNVMFRDGEEAKTSFFVYFGRDHSMSDHIGKVVIDTGCSRLLIGQNTRKM